jgi:hypothetical protein
MGRRARGEAENAAIPSVRRRRTHACWIVFFDVEELFVKRVFTNRVFTKLKRWPTGDDAPCRDPWWTMRVGFRVLI